MSSIFSEIEETLAALRSGEDTMSSIAVDLLVDQLGATVNILRCANTAIRAGADKASIREDVLRYLRDRMRADSELMVRISYASIVRPEPRQEVRPEPRVSGPTEPLRSVEFGRRKSKPPSV